MSSTNVNVGQDEDFEASANSLLRITGDAAALYGFDGEIHGYEDAVSQRHDHRSSLDPNDPAALLEALSHYEHPAMNGTTAVPASDELSVDNFASLLQAAAASAGGQDDELRQMRKDPPNVRDRDAADSPEQLRDPHLERERRSSAPEMDTFIRRGNNTKRKRQLDDEDEEQQLAREREIWGSEEEHSPSNDAEVSFENVRPVAAREARAIGAHSAAALFRRPSAASRKYTRPPMSKLFTSLDLTPEQFLTLQAAAKRYMLDPQHPERRDCVGNRAKGDTEMVKLKLFECVKSFLEDEKWGERFYGPRVPGYSRRRLQWPHHTNKVIALVTPLLRRMVTNERQRQYASTTRAIASKKTPTSAAARKRSHLEQANSETIDLTLDRPTEHPAIDPKLDQYHYTPGASPAASSSVTVTSGHLQSPDSDLPTMPITDITISIVRPASSRPHALIRPQLQLPPSDCSTADYRSILAHINTSLRTTPIMTNGGGVVSQHDAHDFSSDDHGNSDGHASQLRVHAVRVLGPNGLVAVVDNAQWMTVGRAIRRLEWMAGRILVLVEVETVPVDASSGRDSDDEREEQALVRALAEDAAASADQVRRVVVDGPVDAHVRSETEQEMNAPTTAAGS